MLIPKNSSPVEVESLLSTENGEIKLQIWMPLAEESIEQLRNHAERINYLEIHATSFDHLNNLRKFATIFKRLTVLTLDFYDLKGDFSVDVLEDFESIPTFTLNKGRLSRVKFSRHYPWLEKVNRILIHGFFESECQWLTACQKLTFLRLSGYRSTTITCLENVKAESVTFGGCKNIDLNGLQHINTKDFNVAELSGKTKNLQILGQVNVDRLSVKSISSLDSLPEFKERLNLSAFIDCVYSLPSNL